MPIKPDPPGTTTPTDRHIWQSHGVLGIIYGCRVSPATGALQQVAICNGCSKPKPEEAWRFIVGNLRHGLPRFRATHVSPEFRPLRSRGSRGTHRSAAFDRTNASTGLGSTGRTAPGGPEGQSAKICETQVAQVRQTGRRGVGSAEAIWDGLGFEVNGTHPP